MIVVVDGDAPPFVRAVSTLIFWAPELSTAIVLIGIGLTLLWPALLLGAGILIYVAIRILVQRVQNALLLIAANPATNPEVPESGTSEFVTEGQGGSE